MKFVLLADRPDAIPRIARWYGDQWGHLDENWRAHIFEDTLRDFLNRDRIPLMVLAVDQDEVLGVAQLKLGEMDIYPDRLYWLGGVYVPAAHRGKGVAAGVVREVIRVAGSLGLDRLYLQTEHLDGGLYARLGWKPGEQVRYRGIEVLVMAYDLGADIP